VLIISSTATSLTGSSPLQQHQADLEQARLRRAVLRRSNLRYAHLQHAWLDEADLEGADLTGVREDVITVSPAGFDADRRRVAGVVTDRSAGPGIPPIADAT
jgi:hypothetical protein